MRVPMKLARLFSTTTFKPKLELLSHKSLIKIEGDGMYDYCQGLMTNDIFRLKTEKSLFTMILNSKGRVLYDCLVYKVDDHILLECEKDSASDLIKYLRMYLLRRKININVLDDSSVWALFSSTPMDMKLNSVSVFNDPRLPILGQRIISDKTSGIRSEIFLDERDNKFTYQQWRYRNGVAEGSELLKGQSFPLEMNCDYLNGISFNKGCYVGQELTARTHHTGVTRKRIMPLIFDDTPTGLDFDADIYNGSDLGVKRPPGKLRGLCGKIGIALLRIDECLKAEQLIVGGFTAKTFIPNWWKM
ncbi:putative transferase CAF17 homolog, mitochondrial isoform X1 [Metopolophium dirhodum]|uniref:putative transferase CAF17 homolog, mitochondrial isoform X1 n=1 Tax=Metopolophium dirhodum TaxID=44670 RepID=UPI00298FCA2A|nr:putative transferase CAF17 homolog, mitochondrial isoform X1 [Metopolophium dirhodum]